MARAIAFPFLVALLSVVPLSACHLPLSVEPDDPPEKVAVAFINDLDHKFDESARKKIQIHPDAKPLPLAEWPVRDLGRDEEIAGLREEIGMAPSCSLDRGRIEEVTAKPGGYGYFVTVPLKCDNDINDAVTLELTKDPPHMVLRTPGDWLLQRELE